jgi:hypothetical protein
MCLSKRVSLGKRGIRRKRIPIVSKEKKKAGENGGMVACICCSFPMTTVPRSTEHSAVKTALERVDVLTVPHMKMNSNYLWTHKISFAARNGYRILRSTVCEAPKYTERGSFLSTMEAYLESTRMERLRPRGGTTEKATACWCSYCTVQLANSNSTTTKRNQCPINCWVILMTH